MGRTKQTKRKAAAAEDCVEEVGRELVCGVCDEVCKRGVQLACCGARACRACAVIKINRTKKCWKEECGQDADATKQLKNDEVLRKAVNYFKENGKMNPEHAKQIKETAAGTKVETKNVISKIAKEKGEKKPLDPVERFNRPCAMGEKCIRKACLFKHDKPTLADKAKRVKGNGKPCNKGAACINKKCIYAHPDVPVIGKSSKWESKSTIKDFKLSHKLAPLMAGMGPMRMPMGPTSRVMGPMGGGMGPMGGGMDFSSTGMGPMAGGMDPSGGEMGLMDGGMGPMAGGMKHMGGGMGFWGGGIRPMGGMTESPMGGMRRDMEDMQSAKMRKMQIMKEDMMKVRGYGGNMGDPWKKGFRPTGMGSGTMGQNYGGGYGF